MEEAENNGVADASLNFRPRNFAPEDISRQPEERLVSIQNGPSPFV